jgi:hypothetical protein
MTHNHNHRQIISIDITIPTHSVNSVVPACHTGVVVWRVHAHERESNASEAVNDVKCYSGLVDLSDSRLRKSRSPEAPKSQKIVLDVTMRCKSTSGSSDSPTGLFPSFRASGSRNTTGLGTGRSIVHVLRGCGKGECHVFCRWWRVIDDVVRRVFDRALHG